MKPIYEGEEESIRGKRLSTAARTKIKRRKASEYKAKKAKSGTRKRADHQGSEDREKYLGAPAPKYYRMIASN